MSITSENHFYNKVQHYLSLIKFSHTFFALPFAFIGFALAVLKDGYEFKWSLLGLMLLCMVFARSAAMAFNRYIDYHFDAKNPRTANREIPAGVISAKSALVFVIVCSMCFIGSAIFINKICFYLSPIALFVILFYSYTKRFTALCHIVLGLGLSLAPIGAYLAVTGVFSVLPILFSLMVIGWVSGFDIIYALQDEQFDKSIQLNSIPVALGAKKALLLSSVLHTFTAVMVIIVGIYGEFNIWYWLGSMIYVGLLYYQHTLVKPNDLSKVNIAFVNTNSLASILFAIFVIISMLF
jgi:4-hydroxybenzoate polyprenyltransferase